MRNRVQPGREPFDQLIAKSDRVRVLKQMLAVLQFITLFSDLVSSTIHEDVCETRDCFQSMKKTNFLDVFINSRKPRSLAKYKLVHT